VGLAWLVTALLATLGLGSLAGAGRLRSRLGRRRWRGAASALRCLAQKLIDAFRSVGCVQRQAAQSELGLRGEGTGEDRAKGSLAARHLGRVASKPGSSRSKRCGHAEDRTAARHRAQTLQQKCIMDRNRAAGGAHHKPGCQQERQDGRWRKNAEHWIVARWRWPRQRHATAADVSKTDRVHRHVSMHMHTQSKAIRAAHAVGRCPRR
jgi:hypothetical protein